MKFYKTAALSHEICKNYLDENSITIDATCGNGFDTLFLAQNSKFCFAFDIQKEAITNTELLLKKNKIKNYQLIEDSHENFDKYIEKNCDLILFNLGYLPKGKKEITTKAETTYNTINKMLEKIVFKLILLVIYPGHTEGERESHILLKYLSEISDVKFNVFKITNINQNNNAPYILGIEKKTNFTQI